VIGIRRALWLLAIAAGIWALSVLALGGFVLDARLFRISSRGPGNPAVIAVVAAGFAATLAARARPPGFVADAAFFYRPNAFAVALSAAITLLAVLKGAPVAGGADSFGYASQAHLWASGTLKVVDPLMHELAGIVPAAAVPPLGYMPAVEGPAFVPTYAPGLPMMMAALEWLGGPNAVFLAVPLLSGLGVWATFLMGARIATPGVGLGAALLLGTSPLYLSRAMYAESDAPVTALWALTLASLLLPGRGAALASGLAAGLAILTRPNLIPLAGIPGAFLIWRFWKNRTPLSLQRVLLFAAGSAAGCVVFGVMNDYWYGSPFVSGYGTPRDFLHWKNVVPNLARYPLWLVQSETPVVLLAVVAPFVVARLGPRLPAQEARRWLLAWLTFVAAVFGSYVLFRPWDDPGFLRYLLPAFPAIFALTSVAVAGSAGYLPGAAQAIAPALVLSGLAIFNMTEWRSQRVFDHQGTLLYRTMGEYLASRLPDRSVVLSMQHSGSVRYYSGHSTVRWDLIPAGRLDDTIGRLHELGYHPYVVLEGWEEPLFRDRFAASRFGALDWRPVALTRPATVSLYDVEQKQSAAPQPETEILLHR
jgi:hypothetical protein